MQQRKPTSGRPSGTDGFDFSYRMVVDQRYTKVAKGKSRLQALIILQAVSLAIGGLWAAVSASQAQTTNGISIVSIVIALLALIIGNIGCKKSSKNLLRLYMVASSIGVVLSVAPIVISDLSYTVLQDQNVPLLKKLEVVEAGRVLFSAVVQLFAVVTTISLTGNMSAKRAS